MLSGSSAAQWDAELLAALGAELHVDLYEKQSADGHLDILGPYAVKVGETPVELRICLLGLERFELMS